MSKKEPSEGKPYRATATTAGRWLIRVPKQTVPQPGLPFRLHLADLDITIKFSADATTMTADSRLAAAAADEGWEALPIPPVGCRLDPALLRPADIQEAIPLLGDSKAAAARVLGVRREYLSSVAAGKRAISAKLWKRIEEAIWERHEEAFLFWGRWFRDEDGRLVWEGKPGFPPAWRTSREPSPPCESAFQERRKP